jgi:predicted ATPase
LTNLKISGFKCLKSVDVPLKPLTVLIGPNDTGKSAFLSAVKHLSQRFQDCPFASDDFWRFDRTCSIDIVGGTALGEVSKSFTDGDHGQRAPMSGLDLILPISQFQLPMAGIATRCAGFAENESPWQLGGGGERLAAVLDALLRLDRPRFDQVVRVLRDLVPGFENLQIKTPTADTREVFFEIDDGFVMPASQASVGVRLLLFIVVLVHSPQPPRIILLEEPENGVHPRRLEEIMLMLHQATLGAYGGRPSQVIVTTHSPYLLDHVDLETDQVLVFSREEDGSRTARPVDASRMKTFLDEFMLGEVWFNQSEEGLVAKPS